MKDTRSAVEIMWGSLMKNEVADGN